MDNIQEHTVEHVQRLGVKGQRSGVWRSCRFNEGALVASLRR